MNVTLLRAKTSVDAWEIVVWTYRHQLADRVLGRTLFDLEAQADSDDYEPSGHSADGIYTISRIAQVGGRIDGGRYAGLNDRVHPDAVRVVEAVERMPRKVQSIIVRHAKAGLPPELPTVVPTPEPLDPDGAAFRMELHRDRPDRVMTRTGVATIRGVRRQYAIQIAGYTTDVVPVWEQRGKRRIKVGTRVDQVAVEYCPVGWYPDPVLQDLDREIYRLWVEGMRSLSATLRHAALRDHDVVGFQLPYGEPQARQVVVKDARDEDHAWTEGGITRCGDVMTIPTDYTPEIIEMPAPRHMPRADGKGLRRVK